MNIKVWPEKNIYFKEGIETILSIYNPQTKLDFVFVDFSRVNIKEILSGEFIYFLSEGVTFVFICDDYMLPLGLYYQSIICRSYLFSKKDNISIIFNCVNENINLKCNKKTHFRTLNKNEIVFLKMFLLKKMSMKKIAEIIGVSEKTIYSRYLAVSKKMKERKLERLLLF